MFYEFVTFLESFKDQEKGYTLQSPSLWHITNAVSISFYFLTLCELVTLLSLSASYI